MQEYPAMAEFVITEGMDKHEYRRYEKKKRRNYDMYSLLPNREWYDENDNRGNLIALENFYKMICEIANGTAGYEQWEKLYNITCLSDVWKVIARTRAKNY